MAWPDGWPARPAICSHVTNLFLSGSDYWVCFQAQSVALSTSCNTLLLSHLTHARRQWKTYTQWPRSTRMHRSAATAKMQSRIGTTWGYVGTQVSLFRCNSTRLILPALVSAAFAVFVCLACVRQSVCVYGFVRVSVYVRR